MHEERESFHINLVKKKAHVTTEGLIATFRANL